MADWWFVEMLTIILSSQSFDSIRSCVLIYAWTVAHMSGNKLEAMKELDSSPAEDSGIVANHLHQIKLWLLSHSQYLNFTSILVLASVSIFLLKVFLKF